MKFGISLTMSVFILLSALILLLVSFSGPAPGKHGWFHELTPDWSTKITGDYEIDNSVNASHPDALCIRRWKFTTKTNREYLDSVIDGILDYNFNVNWIVARTRSEWFWVNTKTNVIESVPHLVFQKEAPYEVVTLSETMKIPSPPYRYKLRLYAAVLVVIFMFFVTHQLLHRQSRSQS